MAMDIPELEKNVRLMFSSRGDDQKLAQQKLNLFKEDPNSWLIVDKVLKESQFEETKYLALQVLDHVIMTRWKILPKEQQLGIRNFVVDFIIKTSESESTIKQHKTLLNKLDLVLVSILKQEWPQNWPTFISEIVSACHTSLTICENNMGILRLLSEEVFDYSAEQMTSSKTEHLKETMSAEFSSIFQLCTQVLETANQPSLIKATLETLLRFLNWIPLGYIFQTGIITTLIQKFLEPAPYRNLAMKCLTEISGFQNPGKQYDESLIEMFTSVLAAVSRIVPLNIDLKSTYASSNSSDQEFVLNLALFLTAFFANHLRLIENLPNQDYLKHAHFYLVRISQVEDREVFKIGLEYWTKLASELYDETQAMPFGVDPLMISPGHMNGFKNGASSRKNKYDEVLTPLRTVMIEKMLKPEEVLIVENDEGEIVRETIKESDTTQLAEAIRQCLVFLTHLNVAETEQIMTDKLSRQVDGTEWSWQNCNTLCWAIGSISGAMNEETEKRFLVGVIKDLLGLTEQKRGKHNKAVVASNIMYIVGQYPRFLKAHWKFLKTVVNKLFEFMHESHEGVQDMACDTFLKIAKSCKRHFVVLQPSETEPFIDEIVRTMPRITEDLEPHQVHTFYKACGFMINAQGQKSMQERLITDLMSPANDAWDSIIRQATADPSCLQDGDIIKVVGNIMKTNVAACDSIRNYFYPQIRRIFQDMLTMYRATSSMISEAVRTNGPIATKTPKVRGLRTIKKEILKLIETYLERAEDLVQVNNEIVPPLLDAILSDYSQNVPDAREAEVLRVMTVVIERLQQMMNDKIPIIMGNVFECTLNMINKDFSEYPEHRLAFFAMLRVINLHCFDALKQLDSQQFKFIVDSCLWAIKHDNRDVESAGLLMCSELMQNLDQAGPDFANQFFQMFYVLILQDVFYVLMDSDHKSGFKQQATLLSDMFRLVAQNKISAPLYQPGQAAPGTPNADFLNTFVTDLLRKAFSNLTEAQIRNFVNGLFTLNEDANKFRVHLRDFLIQMKEYSGDQAELFEAEREKEEALKAQQDLDARSKVGGLMRPNEIKDEDEL